MNTVEPIRSKQQVLDILSYLKVKNERDYIMFMFGIYTGLRISDILPLRAKDIREKRVGKGKKEKFVYLREKKTGKERTIILNKELQQALTDYIEENKLIGEHYLFPSRQCKSRIRKVKRVKPITRVRALQIIKDAAERFDIENVGTHTLRKTFGYLNYNDTKDIAMLQSIFNHDSPLDTARYIGVDQDKKDAFIRGFSLTK